jgi:uncharacterized protein (UPF0371 family)
MKILKSDVRMDFSVTALQTAIEKLGVSYCQHYIVQVHPSNIHWACKVVEEVNGAATYRRTAAPYISVEMTPLGSEHSWAVWAFDDCFWSEGV